MNFEQIIIHYWKYIVSAFISCCFFVVNIIQVIRSHSKSKLNEAICRIPEIIRDVEIIFGKRDSNLTAPLLPGDLTADLWSLSKKTTALTVLKNEYGDAFVNKHIKVFDDAIEDILNTPQKKGGSNDGISKENEER